MIEQSKTCTERSGCIQNPKSKIGRRFRRTHVGESGQGDSVAVGRAMELKNTSKKYFLLLIAIFCLGIVASVDAQQPTKIRRIGYLANTPATTAVDIQPLRERLRELGYVEGQNLTIEYRYFGSNLEHLPELVGELIRLNVELIAVVGNEAASAATKATKIIPIVMVSTSEAVRSGFVASLARPGGNVTGTTSMGADVLGKRLELLSEIIPKFTRAGFLWSPSSPTAPENLKETESIARSLKIDLTSLEAQRHSRHR